MAARAAARRLGARPERAAHDDAGAGLPARRRVRRPALPSRLLPVLAVLAPARRRSSRRCTAGSTCRSINRCSTRSLHAPVVSISDAQRRPVPQAHWMRDRPSRPAGGPADAAAGASRPISPSSAASAPEKARRPGNPHRRRSAACRSRSPPRSIASTSDYFERRDPAAARRAAASSIIGEINDAQKSAFLSGAHRAAGADRLARAVRPGDDRGDGLRHAGRSPSTAARCPRSSSDGVTGFIVEDEAGAVGAVGPARAAVASAHSRHASSNASPRAAWPRTISPSIAA